MCAKASSPSGVVLEESNFSLYTDLTTGQSIPVRLFTWNNTNNVTLQIIDYGATIISLKVPDKNGVVEDLVLGFNDLQGYQDPDNPFFGATIGRVANRIANGQLSILGTTYNVTKNSGKHQLHGGFKGFDKCSNYITIVVSWSKMPLVTLEETLFGTVIEKAGKQRQVKLFTWTNQNNVSLEVITYGATIVAVKVPDKNGVVEDIVTGFKTLPGYTNPFNRYFGATIGRVANRINRGQMTVAGKTYNLSANIGPNHLHGGLTGFDKVIWEAYRDGTKLVLSYHSADGEEGYPGDLVVNVTFELTADNQIITEYQATTTKPTVVNLTNHSYFNLAGHNKGAAELYKHVIAINADRITVVDDDGIPTGALQPVAGTAFDLQIPKVLGDVINTIPGRDGYDHNFCINKGPEQGSSFIARAYHPPSGRVLEIYSDQPGVQFYTSNFLPDNPDTFKGDRSKLKRLAGKDGNYYKHGAFCLETQLWPDAPNHENFPSAILLPGQTYNQYTTFRLSIKDE